MKPEHSKMEYVRLTMEEYEALVEENKKLKKYLRNAVSVIRCKDCEYWQEETFAGGERYMNCTALDMGYGDSQPRDAEDFCSYAKRRTTMDNGEEELLSREIIETEPIKHGKWKSKEIPSRLWVCSECEGLVNVGYYCNSCYYNYCPYCGAKMDKEEI